MHFEDEIKLLVKDDPDPRKGWWRRCPEDLQLAAYVDGVIDDATRQRLEKHLSDCSRCLDEVSFLVRAGEWPAAEDAAPWLVKKAATQFGPPPKKSLMFDWRWVTATAAVSFAVILFILFAVRFRTPNPPPDRAGATVPAPTASVPTQLAPSPEPRNPNVIAESSPAVKAPEQKGEPAVPLTRSSKAANGLPSLLSPREGASVKRDAFICRWQSVPDSVFYEISVMSASGDIVATRQTEEEALNLSAIPLQAGTRYFVSVRAHLRDGTTIRSRIVSFRVVD